MNSTLLHYLTQAVAKAQSNHIFPIITQVYCDVPICRVRENSHLNAFFWYSWMLRRV